MEIKKSPTVDLERKRSSFFLFGLIATSLLFALLLNMRIGGGDISIDADLLEEIMQDIEMSKEEDDRIEIPLLEVPQKLNGELIREVDQIIETTDIVEHNNQNLFETEADTEEEVIEDEQSQPLMVDDNENVLSWRVVEQLPDFPGGLIEFMRWLTNELQYPQSALRSRQQGSVQVSFVINKDGSVSDIKIEKSAGKVLDEEALRVMNNMPRWTPGEHKGEKCRTLCSVPIVFKL